MSATWLSYVIGYVWEQSFVKMEAWFKCQPFTSSVTFFVCDRFSTMFPHDLSLAIVSWHSSGQDLLFNGERNYNWYRSARVLLRESLFPMHQHKYFWLAIFRRSPDVMYLGPLGGQGSHVFFSFLQRICRSRVCYCLPVIRYLKKPTTLLHEWTLKIGTIRISI